MIFCFTAKLVTLCIDMYGLFQTKGRLIGDCAIPEQNLFSLLSLPGIYSEGIVNSMLIHVYIFCCVTITVHKPYSPSSLPFRLCEVVFQISVQWLQHFMTQGMPNVLWRSLPVCLTTPIRYELIFTWKFIAYSKNQIHENTNEAKVIKKRLHQQHILQDGLRL